MPDRSRRYCLTWNNYPNEYDNNDPLDAWLSGLGTKYVVAGREICPTTGTKHLQLYAEFSNARTFARIRAIFPGCHIEPARGNGNQCREYCIKDGNYREHGIIPQDPGQREKQRWTDALASAKKGSFDDIPADIYVRYVGNLQRIYRDNLPVLDPLPQTAGIWIMGPTGTGKSRGARRRYPGLYPKPLNKWWDGYKDNKHVLLDDVDPSHGSWIGSFLKIWADHYPFIAEKKGGSVMIRPETIIVTSQYTIDEVFAEGELRSAIARRFRVLGVLELLKDLEENPPNC